MTRCMITNGNNVHPADYHAEVTAEKIVVVGEKASSEQISASRELRKKIEAILTQHHCVVGADEQAKLAEHGEARLDHPLDATPHVTDDVVAEIASAARGTVLEAHFARADVQGVIREILHQETRSQMHVHRIVAKAAGTLKPAPTATPQPAPAPTPGA